MTENDLEFYRKYHKFSEKQKLKQEFNEQIEDNLYFTLRGCEMEGNLVLPKTIANFISNISGTCTDPEESEDFYKNPRAMFVALNLIYLAINGFTDKMRK